jgi:hypothetical protein
MLDMEPFPMRRSWLSQLSPFAFCLGLAACNGVPISTQWKLRNFSASTADVAQIRLAVRAPTWATPTPEKSILAAKYDFDDGSPGRKIDIRLRRGDHAEDRAELARLAPGGGLVVYEAAPGEYAAARALQSEIEAAKQAGRHGRGFVELGGSLACRTGPIPEGPILIDAYIHASDEIGWLPLVEREEMRDRLNADEKRDEHVPACEQPGGHAAR